MPTLTVEQIVLYALLALFVVWVAFGFQTVVEWERKPIFFFGRYAWTAGPGIIWIPPILFQGGTNVSVQKEVRTVAGLHARTKDNVPIVFDLTVVSRVLSDGVREAVVQIKNGRYSVDAQAKPSAVENIGKTDFERIQSEEGKFADTVLETLRKKVEGWGIEVSQLGISNIRITDESIAEAIAKKPKAIAEAEAEDAFYDKLSELAAKYKVPVFALRQLVAVNAMGANGKAVVVPSNIAEIMSIVPKEELPTA
jgi:regulator of protease activity HflC (stomatin/prohibitin superfamily)